LELGYLVGAGVCLGVPISNWSSGNTHPCPSERVNAGTLDAGCLGFRSSSMRHARIPSTFVSMIVGIDVTPL